MALLQQSRANRQLKVEDFYYKGKIDLPHAAVLLQWCAIEMQCLLHKHYINGVDLSQDYNPNCHAMPLGIWMLTDMM